MHCAEETLTKRIQECTVLTNYNYTEKISEHAMMFKVHVGHA